VTLTLDRQEIEDLKARVDLVALLQEHGVQVKKQGRGFKALCPFHDESTPSLSIDRGKGVYHCFGCGQKGDHLSFLQLHAKLSFQDALAQLHQRTGSPPRTARPAAEEPFPYDLMARLAEVWHQAFCERPEGQAYLESRGICDRELMRAFQVGYCDGEQLLAITGEAERPILQRVGVFNEGGKEFFSRCVVFPLKDRENRVVGFVGRSTLPGSKVPHRLCAGNRQGLFYPTATQGATSVILVEGVLDALAVMQAGFLSVMATGGAQACPPALLEHLVAAQVSEVTLCFDGDEAGQQGARTLQARLEKAGLKVRNLTLPEAKDPAKCSPAELQKLLAPPAPAPVAPRRQYRKLSTAQGRLKVLVTVTNEAGARAESTVDLYSSRSRKQEALSLARRLGLCPSDLEQWFLEVLHELEEIRQGESQAQALFKRVEVPPMTAEERAAALSFLKHPDLVEAILKDMEAMGYVGENEAKLLGYCVSVSRKLEKPMSAIIQSGSGAGKSYLAEVIRHLTPPEDVVFYSRLSPQALYHMPQDYLVHKLLELEERVGAESCDYQIRALQSAGVLHQVIVVKDPNTGQLMVRENEVRGPMAYVETTTSLKLNPENTSRCFEIPLDESPEQTRRIHQRQKALRSLSRLSSGDAREEIQKRHYHAQRLLEAVPVVIPYVDLLTFPDHWLRARRDHDRFLTLIEVLAYLHQYQRPRKLHQGVEYLEATVADYRWAYFLAHKVLRNSLDELSRWSREMLTYFETEKPGPLTRREIREQLGWPDKRTRDALEELAELEYLEVERGPRNLFTFSLAASPTTRAQSAHRLLTPDELVCQFDRP